MEELLPILREFGPSGLIAVAVAYGVLMTTRTLSNIANNHLTHFGELLSKMQNSLDSQSKRLDDIWEELRRTHN